MRFMYKLLLGLIIFNSMLVIFSYYMPHSTAQYGAENITSDYSSYRTANIESYITRIFSDPSSLILFAILMGIGGLGSLFAGIHTKAFLGISLVFSFVMYVLDGSLNVFTNMTNYPVVSGLFSFMLILIGIVFFLSIGDALMDRGDMA